ncbi:MAG: hypothetical protein ACREX4_24440 [Gammaproteobacteria bacterium]
MSDMTARVCSWCADSLPSAGAAFPTLGMALPRQARHEPTKGDPDVQEFTLAQSGVLLGEGKGVDSTVALGWRRTIASTKRLLPPSLWERMERSLPKSFGKPGGVRVSKS